MLSVKAGCGKYVVFLDLNRCDILLNELGNTETTRDFNDMANELGWSEKVDFKCKENIAWMRECGERFSSL